MDTHALASAQADLVAWGLLEPAGPPRLSRRGQAALARAAAWLRQQELEGRAPEGHPMVLAAQVAIESTVPDGTAPTTAHHRLLAAIEIAGLPDGVRGMFTAESGSADPPNAPDASRHSGVPGPAPPAP